MILTALDLFCGAGGLSLGLREAGFDVLGGVDDWPVALETYRANFPTHIVIPTSIGGHQAKSLLRTDLPTVDLIAGGPPCQGFSVQRIGKDFDARNDLVVAFGHAVNMLRPKMLLMENVPGLLGARGRKVLAQLVRDLADGGYQTKTRLLDAADFGVPQHRKRVFLVGWRANEYPEFEFPEPHTASTKRKSVRDAIRDLPSPPADYSPTIGDPLHRRMRLSKLNEERIALIPPGGGFEDLPIEMRVACHRDGAAKIGHRYVYGRLDPDRPASTITARFDSFTRGRFGHPWENRTISLREGARLQSFPDTYKFLGTQEEIAAQIGNAIPPVLAARLGRAIREHLATSDKPVASPVQTSMQFGEISRRVA
jgi:DNA (cytosine-5)-methyltransferase 1